MPHPRLWGDTYWNTMHMLAAMVQDMPLADPATRLARSTFGVFLCCIPPLLPCANCVRDAPVIFVNRLSPEGEPVDLMTADLDVLMCDLHNDVNTKLDKPIMPVELAKARAVALRQEINSKLVWDFVIMTARALRPKTLFIKYQRCMQCLEVLLRLLDNNSLANAVAAIHVKKSQDALPFIYPSYAKWHKEHKLPYPLTKQEFISRQQYDQRKSPLNLA